MIDTRELTAREHAFAAGAARRKRIFMSLAIAGVAVALGLAAYYAWRLNREPAFPIGPRAVIVLLILLNARQNLRQHRYAVVLEKLLPRGDSGGENPLVSTRTLC